jgi:hypothetical protein
MLAFFAAFHFLAQMKSILLVLIGFQSARLRFLRILLPRAHNILVPSLFSHDLAVIGPQYFVADFQVFIHEICADLLNERTRRYRSLWMHTATLARILHSGHLERDCSERACISGTTGTEHCGIVTRLVRHFAGTDLGVDTVVRPPAILQAKLSLLR